MLSVDIISNGSPTAPQRLSQGMHFVVGRLLLMPVAEEASFWLLAALCEQVHACACVYVYVHVCVCACACVCARASASLCVARCHQRLSAALCEQGGACCPNGSLTAL